MINHRGETNRAQIKAVQIKGSGSRIRHIDDVPNSTFEQACVSAGIFGTVVVLYQYSIE